jgi:hypothetical protein
MSHEPKIVYQAADRSQMIADRSLGSEKVGKALENLKIKNPSDSREKIVEEVKKGEFGLGMGMAGTLQKV